MRDFDFSDAGPDPNAGPIQSAVEGPGCFLFVLLVIAVLAFAMYAKSQGAF